jgi:hypothetical protein
VQVGGAGAPGAVARVAALVRAVAAALAAQQQAAAASAAGEHGQVRGCCARGWAHGAWRTGAV